MSSSPFPNKSGPELLATLEDALGATLDLANRLSTDPLVGSEARGLLSRLDCIRAEIDVIAALKDRPWRFQDNDGPSTAPAQRLWN